MSARPHGVVVRARAICARAAALSRPVARFAGRALQWGLLGPRRGSRVERRALERRRAMQRHAAQPGDAALPARARLRTIASARARLAGCRQAILQSASGVSVFRGLTPDLLFRSEEHTSELQSR